MLVKVDGPRLSLVITPYVPSAPARGTGHPETAGMPDAPEQRMQPGTMPGQTAAPERSLQAGTPVPNGAPLPGDSPVPWGSPVPFDLSLEIVRDSRPAAGRDGLDDGSDGNPAVAPGLSRPRFPEPLIHELDSAQVERLLLWCVEERASDVVFCPGDPVWMQVDGVWHAVTDTVLTDSETMTIVNASAGQSNRAGLVKAGRSLDYAWSLAVPGLRLVRQRFRVNATATTKGVYVVMRALPRDLPRLEDMEGLAPDLREALFPQSGLVVVSGVMGSGKSTLLAAVLREAVLGKHRGRQILTLEDPVEFDFGVLLHGERSAPLAQSAVHLDVENWPDGVRTLTRRKGEIVMVGECRDRETIAALLSTVEQGVAAYTTVHAQDVPQTLARMIHVFPEDERAAVSSVLKANARVLVHQRLVPRRPDPSWLGLPREKRPPGRVALREHLVLTDSLRRHLLTVSDDRLVPEVRTLVEEKGTPLAADARRHFERGAIDRETYAAVTGEPEQTRGGNGRKAG